MGDRKRPAPAQEPGPKGGLERAAVKWKIIGRLLLDGGTVEEPLRGPSLGLELPAARSARLRRKGAR